jgi:hypothetical protein
MLKDLHRSKTKLLMPDDPEYSPGLVYAPERKLNPTRERRAGVIQKK